MAVQTAGHAAQTVASDRDRGAGWRGRVAVVVERATAAFDGTRTQRIERTRQRLGIGAREQGLARIPQTARRGAPRRGLRRMRLAAVATTPARSTATS